MAVIDKRLAKGTLTNTNTLLYTAPASPGTAKTIVKSVTLCNKTDLDDFVTLKLAGTEIMSQQEIKARSTYTIPYLDQILHASELLEGNTGNNSSINYYISGREVT